MTMVCVVGDPDSIKGSGKTLTLTFLQYLDYCKGRRILSNVKYNFPYEQLNVAQVIEDLDNGLQEKYKDVSIGIDEFHLFMPSGQTAGNAEDKRMLVNFMLQTRKLDIDVYFTTHRAGMVDFRIRPQVEMVLMVFKHHTKDTESTVAGEHCTFDNCKEEHYIEVRNVTEFEYAFSKDPVYLNPNVVGKLYPTNQILDISASKYFQPKGKKSKPIYRPNTIYKTDDEPIEVEEALNKVNAEIAKLEQEEADEEIESENNIIQQEEQEEHKDLINTNIYTKRRIIPKRK